MNRLTVLMLIAGVFVLLASMLPAPALAAPRMFTATLSGSNEVPPKITMATGEATFMLSDDGGTLTYTITVANINDVIAAHIHLAAAGVNGPVVVPLFAGSFSGSGVLAQGTITSANLGGLLAGMPLSALIERIDSGNAYVNVHTIVNPGGELRGQIMPSMMP